jgi:hypothetical protein
MNFQAKCSFTLLDSEGVVIKEESFETSRDINGSMSFGNSKFISHEEFPEELRSVNVGKVTIVCSVRQG